MAEIWHLLWLLNIFNCYTYRISMPWFWIIWVTLRKCLSYAPGCDVYWFPDGTTYTNVHNSVHTTAFWVFINPVYLKCPQSAIFHICRFRIVRAVRYIILWIIRIWLVNHVGKRCWWQFDLRWCPIRFQRQNVVLQCAPPSRWAPNI
jgi:hypothetical protein